MKILLATPAFGGILTTRYFDSFLKTMGAISEAGHEMSVITMDRDALISRARNALATLALENNFDKLLFIDSDTVWEPEHVFMLLNSDKKIIGGTYPYKKFPIKLVYQPLPKHFVLENGEAEVLHLPTGFMLIDISVLKAMTKTALQYLWFDEVTKKHKNIYNFFPIGLTKVPDTNIRRYDTEDWGFCSQARGVGFKVFLQTKCVVDHLGLHQFSFRD